VRPAWVIDLKGFTLLGTGPFNGQIAIYCQNADNVTVQNGKIELFTDGVDFQAGAQQVVQNLILLNNELSVIMQGCSYCTIQNCLIVGTGTGSSPVCEGVYLTTDLGVVVKNCQISNAFDGYASGATNGNIFIANQLSNCDYGLFLDTTDKYQGNVEINAGFAGGIAVGYENN
jgi:nitrous oxidase accessory protein NosD